MGETITNATLRTLDPTLMKTIGTADYTANYNNKTLSNTNINKTIGITNMNKTIGGNMFNKTIGAAGAADIFSSANYTKDGSAGGGPRVGFQSIAPEAMELDAVRESNSSEQEGTTTTLHQQNNKPGVVHDFLLPLSRPKHARKVCG